MLRNVRITKKILAIVAFGVLCLGLIAAYSLFHVRSVIIDERKASIKAAVEQATSIAEYYEGLAASGKMDREQAQRDAASVIRNLKYGTTGYIYVYRMDGVLIANRSTLQNEGKSRLDSQDSRGNRLVEMQINAAKAGGGFVTFWFPKIGTTEPIEKTAYDGPFTPWNWAIGTGVYFDDIDAAFYKEAISVGIAFLVALAGLIAVSLAISRSITAPIGNLSNVMHGLAKGDLDVVIDTDRGDEIGQMAKAVEIFKETGIAKRAADEREATDNDRRMAGAKRLETLATGFDGVAKTAIGGVEQAAGTLQATSEGLNETAKLTSVMLGEVASAATQTSANVQTVASAAEELSASIREITSQVAESSRIASNAVTEADRTTDQVRSLAHAAQEIGTVVALINEIASQTNLLALNATIEAARAGEAGRGFAVVASEVKQLAGQTAKATTDIARHIAGIQSETDQAVTAISAIGATIRKIDSISTGIAAAVEEQGAATQEIARSVQQAADGSRHVIDSIAGVEAAAARAKQMAGDVLSASGILNENCGSLKGSVVNFLNGVRAG